jgi:hypothetical protein
MKRISYSIFVRILDDVCPLVSLAIEKRRHIALKTSIRDAPSPRPDLGPTDSPRRCEPLPPAIDGAEPYQRLKTADAASVSKRIHTDIQSHHAKEPAHSCRTESSGPRDEPRRIEQLMRRHGIRAIMARPRRIRDHRSSPRLSIVATTSRSLRT